MDEDEVLTQLSVLSSDDEDYLCDLDEDLLNLSSENEEYFSIMRSGVARTDPGPSYAVPDSDSECEIRMVRNRRTGRILDDESEDDEDNGGNTSAAQKGHSYRNVTNRDDPPPQLTLSLGEKSAGPQIPGNVETPIQFFKLFFTPALVRKIVVETNKYAKAKIGSQTLSKYSIWHSWMDITEEEMWAFLGVIINMGLIEQPEIKDYWSQDFANHIPFFSQIFTRRRFLEIFWMLHLETVPESMDLRTRTQKVSNFLKYIDERCRQYFIPNQNISIDEATVGYKGKIVFITYNPKKPTKWGIRIYVLADSATSYIYTFIPYHGKITTESLIRPDLPFTSRIVLHLYNNLRESWPNISGYHIFTDRFYTSPTLARELYILKCHLTGTLLSSRKDVPSFLKKPALKKGEKIAYRDDNILLLSWRDKRVITMLSTWSTSNSEIVTKKWKGAAKEDIVVTKPSVVVNYTKNMGAVDTADQYTSSYCFLRKTLKWWRKLFFWGMEVSIINSYILYKELCKNKGSKIMTHVQFRRQLLKELVGDFRGGTPSTKKGRPSSSDQEERLNGKLHIIISHPEGKHKDCLVCSNRSVPGGRRETTYICETCTRKPGLHVGNCFKRYHTMKNFKIH